MHAGCHTVISAKPLRLRGQGASAAAIFHRPLVFFGQWRGGTPVLAPADIRVPDSAKMIEVTLG